jgi:hypothetical protein
MLHVLVLGERYHCEIRGGLYSETGGQNLGVMPDAKVHDMVVAHNASFWSFGLFGRGYEPRLDTHSSDHETWFVSRLLL